MPTYGSAVYGYAHYGEVPEVHWLLPAEGTYTDIEHDLIENEPPGLFPGDQNSNWGQTRKVFADYLQVLADKMGQWYTNLDPRTVDINDIGEWEDMVGVPRFAADRTLEQRRAFVMARFQRGPFTRTRRRLLVESFIAATFGVPIIFSTDGVAFTAGGVPFFSGADSLVGTYRIVEDIPNFHYDVRILDTITVDEPGLTRELDRITPAGISFTIISTPAP